MPDAVLAWLLMVALGAPRAVWPLLFQLFGGSLPTTSDEFNTLCQSIRQRGHIAEHTHAEPRDLNEGMGMQGH